MTRSIQIISAALPPQLDGIGDHTALLAAQLARVARVKVLLGSDEPASPLAGVSVEPCFSATDPRTCWKLLDRVAADPPEWLLLQYNPFAYGRRGLNLQLPRVIRAIRRACPQTRFALIVHETFVPVINWQFAVMTTWQRWQFWQLCRAADTVLFSIEQWLLRFRRRYPDHESELLPVGSNVPAVPISRDEARRRLNLPEGAMVLGLFGTAHPSRLLGTIRVAAARAQSAGFDARLLYLGPDGQKVREQARDIPSITDGPLAPDEISRRLAAVDIFLSPYSDGISTRRGAMMAGLQHGLPMVGTSGELSDSMLLREDGHAFLLARASNPLQFSDCVLRLANDAALRRRIGEEGRRLYQREFAWDRIAERLLRALDAPCATADAATDHSSSVPDLA